MGRGANVSYQYERSFIRMRPLPPIGLAVTCRRNPTSTSAKPIRLRNPGRPAAPAAACCDSRARAAARRDITWRLISPVWLLTRTPIIPKFMTRTPQCL